jgi:hypothetical protein
MHSIVNPCVIGEQPGLVSFTWTWGVGDTADFLTINVTAVPEPSTYAFMLARLGVVGWAARKVKRR